MTVFNAGPRAQTIDFKAGDVGYVPKGQGHYIKNTGATDLQFLAIFRAPVYQEVGLSEWLRHTPPALVAQHLNIDPAEIAKFPQDHIGIQPGSRGRRKGGVFHLQAGLRVKAASNHKNNSSFPNCRGMVQLIQRNRIMSLITATNPLAIRMCDHMVGQANARTWKG